MAAVGLGTDAAVGAGEWGHRGGQDCGGLSDHGRLPHQLRLTSCSRVTDAWFSLYCEFGNGDAFLCGQAVLVLVKGVGSC